MTNDTHEGNGRTALVTGGSRGLGRALTTALLGAGWTVVTDGRDSQALARLRAEVPNGQAPLARPALPVQAVRGGQFRQESGRAFGALIAVPGDVADPDHRRALLGEVASLGGLDLLVNNASVLGPSPQPALADYPIDVLREVYAVNLLAPLALTQLVLPYLEGRAGRVINLSSDAAVEPYEGWGGYGSSKAALDQLSSVLAAERPGLRIYAFDPGDMRTDMHAQAFPGEDISDRPEPETVLPALFRLIEGDLPSARYRAATMLAQVSA